MTSKALNIALQELQEAQDVNGIDKALENVTTFSEGTSDDKDNLINALNNVLESGKFSINAKLKRKVTRLRESLSAVEEPKKEISPVTATTTTIAGKSTNKTNQIASNKPQISEKKEEEVPSIVDTDPNLTTTIENVRNSKTAAELESALAPIRSAIGTCTSRRKLKRAIDQSLKLEAIQKEMNAKVRRRVNRALKALSPEENGETLTKAKNEEQKKAAKRAKNGDQEEDDDEQANKKRKVPYVVFIGQLGYDTTALEIEQFLRFKGIQGGINVRLLTNKEDGSFKGMAFVEVDTAEIMYQCIALHHSFFKGRKINIEKSCGGSNKEKRTEKIQLKKQEQIGKINELTDKVLQSFSAEGVIDLTSIGESFKSKIYFLGPSILSKVN